MSVRIELTWLLGGILVLFMLVMLLAKQAQALPPIVEAECDGAECTCDVGQVEGRSVEFIRVDVDGHPSRCVDLEPLHSLKLKFSLRFVEGEEPVYRLRAYALPGCQGRNSGLSSNPCVVTEKPLKSPVFIAPEG